ncbi:MAG: MotA/TolQ/ExbB proton channel family protein [Myxococcota bacterium]
MTLGQLLAEGGWPMGPIYLCSVATTVVVLYKWSQYRAARLGDMSWLERVLEPLRRGNLDRAHSDARAETHPAARAIAAALQMSEHRPDRVSAEAARVGGLELQRFERHLGVLSFIAQVAPLLGLLGTVVGMVSLFFDLEQSPRAAGDISVLSSGMWTALLTTAAGLVVAVAALAGHSYLAARTDALRLCMTDAIEQVLSAAPPGLLTDLATVAHAEPEPHSAGDSSAGPGTRP